MSCANGGDGWQRCSSASGSGRTALSADAARACADRLALVGDSRDTTRRGNSNSRRGRRRSSATSPGLCRRSISLFHSVTAATQSACVRRRRAAAGLRGFPAPGPCRRVACPWRALQRAMIAGASQKRRPRPAMEVWSGLEQQNGAALGCGAGVISPPCHFNAEDVGLFRKGQPRPPCGRPGLMSLRDRDLCRSPLIGIGAGCPVPLTHRVFCQPTLIRWFCSKWTEAPARRGRKRPSGARFPAWHTNCAPIDVDRVGARQRRTPE